MATATEPDVQKTQAQPKTEIVLRVSEQQLANVESIVDQCGFAAVTHLGHFTRAIRMATGIRMLREAITKEMMLDIMALQNTKLGFRTDHTGRNNTPNGYTEDVVKTCFIEAMMYGALPVGNEWNIIADSTYLTKEFYTRKLNELPGLEYVPMPGVPVIEEGGKRARVPFVVSWAYRGRPGKLERVLRKFKNESGVEEMHDERIPVRVNSGMGDDAVIGKATRKMFKAVYDLLSGIQTPDGDLDDAIDVESRPAAKSLEQLTERLTSQPGPANGDAGLSANLKAAKNEFAACKTAAAAAHARKAYDRWCGPSSVLNDEERAVVTGWYEAWQKEHLTEAGK